MTNIKTKGTYTDSDAVAAARREKLREWVDKVGGTTALAELSGLNRVHIEKLLTEPTGSPSSHRDILGLRAETVEKLLTGLGISDKRAQEELQIPEKLRKRWRTLRPAPLGEGAPESDQYVEVVADQPIQMLIEPGHTLMVDPATTDTGSVLVRANGHYMVMPASAVPSGVENLGQLVSVHTLIRRKVL